MSIKNEFLCTVGICLQKGWSWSQSRLAPTPAHNSDYTQLRLKSKGLAIYRSRIYSLASFSVRHVMGRIRIILSLGFVFCQHILGYIWI